MIYKEKLQYMDQNINGNTQSVVDMTKNYHGDALALSENELIHIRQFHEIKQLFKRQYAYAKEAKADDDDHNNTIAVFAKRGYGKTTFVKSFLSYVCKDDAYSCCGLNIIDPSMLEMKQHPFIHVLSLIHEQVERYIEKNDNMQDPNDERFHAYSGWKDAYRRLRKSLSVLDCVGESNFYKDWDDDEHIARVGMKQAEDANSIRSNFVRYVNESLTLIKKDCFLLVFDDIDTNFAKGYDILETIRKYLTVNRIITIMTGDLGLYTKLIRQNLWTGFKCSYLKLEKEHSNNSFYEITELIDQLEEQYLLKILKPENRITLNSVYEKEREGEPRIVVRYNNEQGITEEPLDTLYDKLCSRVGYTPQSIRANEVINFIKSLPFRTQMRIVTACCTPSIYKSPSVLVKDIVRIFRTDISLKSNFSDADIMHIDNFGEILDFLIAQNCLSQNSNFMPESSDMTLNKVLFAVGSVVNSELCNDPHLIFDYWIRVSYVKRCTEEHIQKMIAFSGLNIDKSLNKAYCMSQAYCKAKIHKIVDGNPEDILLPGVCKIDDYGNFAKSYSENPLMGLALFETRSTTDNLTCFISIYKLLASIGDILHTNKSRSQIAYMLNLCSQFRSYLEPQNDTPELRRDAVEKGNVNYISASVNFEEEAERLSYWVRKWVTKNISASMLDHIFVRAYYGIYELENVDYQSAGEKFNAMIIAFLNSVLVEDALDKGITNVDLNNRGNVILTFLKNLIDVGKKESLTFFKSMIQCPLLIDFIDPYYKKLFDLVQNPKFGQGINIEDAVLRRMLNVEKEKLNLKIGNLKRELQEIGDKMALCNKIKNKIHEYIGIKDDYDEDKNNQLIRETLNLIHKEDHGRLLFEDHDNLYKLFDNGYLETEYKNKEFDYLMRFIELTSEQNVLESKRKEVTDKWEKAEKSPFNGHIKIDDNETSLYKSLCAIYLL